MWAGRIRFWRGALLVGVAMLFGVAPAQSSSGDADVPILGQTVSMGTADEGELGVISVHGVRRTSGATIIYFSLGKPPGADSAGDLGGMVSTFYDWLGGSTIGDIGLVDAAGQRIFRPLEPGPDDKCICSPLSAANSIDPGKASVMWAAVVPLPDEVTTVDVAIGDQVVLNVAVEDGLMQPAVEGTEKVILGMGWPQVDEQLIASAKIPDPAAYPLTSRISDIDQTVTQSKGEVALNADVLFAKNSAEVSAKGKQTIEKAAGQIKEANSGNSLAVVGHTDSDGADAYNVDLSKRRADAVAAVLRPILGNGFALTTDGKGESEPIASNETDEGKAKNRRVSVAYTEGS